MTTAEPREVGVLLSTCPPGEADGLAAFLVERKLAACVNILSGVRSVYRWQENIERDDEALLVIKCRTESIPELIETLAEKHPYDVPEILAVDVRDGYPPYLAWVLGNTVRSK